MAGFGAPNKFGALWFLREMAIFWYNSSDRAAVLDIHLDPRVTGPQHFNAFCYETIMTMVDLAPTVKHATQIFEAILGRGKIAKPALLSMLENYKNGEPIKQQKAFDRSITRLNEIIWKFRRNDSLGRDLTKAIALRHDADMTEESGLSIREVTPFMIYDEAFHFDNRAPGL